jgi:hypothetical protein
MAWSQNNGDKKAMPLSKTGERSDGHIDVTITAAKEMMRLVRYCPANEQPPYQRGVPLNWSVPLNCVT